MGYKHIDSLNQIDEELPLQERVGRNVHGEDFISSDGKMVAIGAKDNDDNGKYSGHGHVRVSEWSCSH